MSPQDSVRLRIHRTCINSLCETAYHLYEQFMDLLFELYRVSYPMIWVRDSSHVQTQGDPSLEDRVFIIAAITVLVHGRGRILRAIPGCPVQGMQA